MLPYMKKDFTNVIHLRSSGWGNHPVLSGWTQWNNKCSYKREVGESATEKGGMIIEAKGWNQRFNDTTLLALKTEDGSWAKERRWPLVAGKGKKTAPSEEVWSWWHFDFIPVYSVFLTPRTRKQSMHIVLSQQGCGNLLGQHRKEIHILFMTGFLPKCKPIQALAWNLGLRGSLF